VLDIAQLNLREDAEDADDDDHGNCQLNKPTADAGQPGRLAAGHLVLLLGLTAEGLRESAALLAHRNGAEEFLGENTGTFDGR
jgi:hypothetical protein